MIEPKVFSVGQINRYIKNLLENDFILSSLLVQGEISNFKESANGHLYFTLKDASGAVSCIMFRQDAERMPFDLENGMQVILYGRISLYEKTGQYQFYAEFVEPVGIGALQLAFEQLKEKLSAEGLFDVDFKREIPSHVETIAVVTSPTGAVIRDVIQIAKRRDSRVKIVVIPTAVQGAAAADEIAEGIRLANAWGKADVLIVGRGGGAMEDLWAFNEEKVARAIFASEIPVISAVGHETDFTIADFVADMRAPTPSAAAELATESLENLDSDLEQIYSRLWRSVSSVLDTSERRFAYIKERPVLKRPLTCILRLSAELQGRERQMTREMERGFLQVSERLQGQEARLFASSPLAVMGRGYAVLTDQKGKTISSMEQVQAGDKLSLHLKDGRMKVEILEKAVFTHGEKETFL